MAYAHCILNPRLTQATKKAPSARLRANIRVHLLIFIPVIFLASGKISAFLTDYLYLPVAKS